MPARLPLGMVLLAVWSSACASNPAPSATAKPPPQPPCPALTEAGGAAEESIEGLRFDPRGADFTEWIKDFKEQVYRNWIVPQAAMFYGGHVDLEFTLEKDGSPSSLRLLCSSGTSSLDRSARNSITASRFKPLPDDDDKPDVTMQVTFYYNEKPRGTTQE